MRRAFRIAPLAVLLSLLPATAHAPAHRLSALAPVELVAEGFREPVGVAVDEAGAIFVSDERAGTVTRILPGRRPTTIVTGLQRPVGLALDREGRLLIVEERSGRLLRREPSGTIRVLASRLARPRWVAAADDGTLYVSGAGLRRQWDDEEQIDAWHRHEEAVLPIGPGGRLRQFAGGFTGLEGIAVQGETLYALTERLRGEREEAGSTLVRIPIRANGSAGPMEVLVRGKIHAPAGLAVDRLGAVFFTATRPLGVGHQIDRRVILKWFPDGRLASFASGLRDTRGLAFEPAGHLLVADGSGGAPPFFWPRLNDPPFPEGWPHGGRLLRFRAPAPPTLNSLPPFTNQSAFTVGGVTTSLARLDVFVNDAGTSLTGTSDASGAFSIPVPLAPDAENSFEVFTTTHLGNGLTSPPAEARLTHDGIPPGLAFRAPPANASVRNAVTVEVQATDGGSGVASLVLSADGRVLTATLSPAPPAPSVIATALWDTTALPDGTHLLTAAATDRAGNSTTAIRSVIVDNTPPDTQITGGPGAEISVTEATFTFTATDNLTPPENLLFSWSLDGGPFTPFGAATTATVTGLTEGPHTFQVRGRDLAGNEDLTPAQLSFRVSRLRVAITEPSDGATLTAGLVLVRGIVEAGGAEAGIVVNGILAIVEGGAFSALVPVSVETSNLTAVATTAKGATATHTIAVSVTPTAALPVVLHASPSSGVAPLSVAFSLIGVPLLTEVSLDADGDGRTDFSGARLEQQPFTFTQPGVYVSTATMTDAQGRRQTVSTVVQVFDKNALDGLLQATWTSLKDSLRRGDIPQALAQIVDRARGRYSAIFTALAQDLPDVDIILTDLFLVEVRGVEAIYEMVRIDDGVTRSFEVRFLRDDDGIWRLWMF